MATRAGEMWLRFPDGGRTGLGYCSNVHPVEDVDAAIAALGRYCGPVRERLGAPLLVTGLWLSAAAASKLVGAPDRRARFRDALAENGLELIALNGFPYGDFHAERVKEAVYRPDWTDPRRYRYTLELARILSEFLPSHAQEGTISTLPLADRSVAAGAEEECAIRLVDLSVELDRLAQRYGRPIRVCLEPEPDCLLETTDELIRFVHDRLVPTARRLGIHREAIERHLGACIDLCHQAVQFEDGLASWRRLRAAGIRAGKVQLSCALEAAGGGDPAEALAPFDEPRFLHQVRRGGPGNWGGRWRDLLDARPHLAPGERVRVHFHVPLHWCPQTASLRTTASELLELIPAIAATRPLPYLEVETYTWSVLPEAVRPRDDASLIDGIARELRFAEEALARAGGRRE